MRKSFAVYVFFTVMFLSFLYIANWNVAQAVEFRNPLKYETFEELIKAILRFMQVLASTVTSIVIILAGYYFVASAGEPAKVTRARHMIIYALIGLLIILIAEGIIQLIEKVIKG